MDNALKVKVTAGHDYSSSLSVEIGQLVLRKGQRFLYDIYARLKLVTSQPSRNQTRGVLEDIGNLIPPYAFTLVAITSTAIATVVYAWSSKTRLLDIIAPSTLLTLEKLLDYRR